MENIVRKLDELGRIVLPIEIRRNLGWYERNEIELIVNYENDTVTLKKHNNTCYLCGNSVDLKAMKGHYICQTCIEDIKSY